jgi:copper chaperone CopZ
MDSHNISIVGMSCGHCLQHITRAIHSIPSVKAADVRMGAATVQLLPGASPDPVLWAIRDAGYEARIVQPAEEAPR